MQCTGRLLFLQHREGRGAAPWRPSKAWPPLPVWGADGYQMAGEERGGGVLYSLPLSLHLSFVPAYCYSSACILYFSPSKFSSSFSAPSAPTVNCSLMNEDEKESDGEPVFAGIQAIYHALCFSRCYIPWDTKMSLWLICDQWLTEESYTLKASSWRTRSLKVHK